MVQQQVTSLSAVLQALQKNPALGTGPWLDLGTGSGAIALGLASILPKAAQVRPVTGHLVAIVKYLWLQAPCLGCYYKHV